MPGRTDSKSQIPIRTDPKSQIHLRKTDNTMAKRKMTNNEPQSATKIFNVCLEHIMLYYHFIVIIPL
jgi:hypothetical protein